MNIKEQILSFLAKWLKIDLQKKVILTEKFPSFVRERDVFVLTKKNLAKIMPGMYWFTDNTFSANFQTGKNVRAVVLDVGEKGVIGWLPDETSLTCFEGQNYSAYRKQVLHNDKDILLQKRLPTIDDWVLTFTYYQILCQACHQANVPDFSGFYWCWGRVCPSVRYVPKTGERAATFRDSGAKVRWLLEAELK